MFQDNSILVASGHKLLLYHHNEDGRRVGRPEAFFHADGKIVSVSAIEEKTVGTVLLLTADSRVIRLSVEVRGELHGMITKVETSVVEGARYVFLPGREHVLVSAGPDFLGYTWLDGELLRDQSYDIELPTGANVLQVDFGGNGKQRWLFVVDSGNQTIWQFDYLGSGWSFGEARPFLSGVSLLGLACGTRPGPGHDVEAVVFVTTTTGLSRYDEFGNLESTVKIVGIQSSTLSAYFDNKITMVRTDANDMDRVIEVQSVGRDILPEPIVMARRPKISSVVTTSSVNVIVG
jgi:hypothetical protein